MKASALMSKARRSLAAAQLLFDNGFLDEACSRAYYAMFEAARAALSDVDAPDEARSARSHSGVISAFGRYVVSAGLVAPGIGRTLGQVQNLRLVADYRGDPISVAEAAQAIAWASAFLESVEDALRIDRTPGQS